jgi:lactam utilization protein B
MMEPNLTTDNPDFILPAMQRTYLQTLAGNRARLARRSSQWETLSADRRFTSDGTMVSNRIPSAFAMG